MSETAKAYQAIMAFWRAAGVEPPPRLEGAPAPRRTGQGPAAAAPSPRALPPPRSESPTAAAARLAAAAPDLAALAEAVAAFDGCALKAAARRTVFSDGPADAPVMLIGEAPGKEEDEQGKPFVGRSGQLLDRMFAAIGLSRAENLFITNVIYWRPPGNRAPEPGEIAVCRPFVERAIALKQPKLLVLAGAVAMQAMLKPTAGVMRMRGKRLTYPGPALTTPLNAMVILHPAYLLRRPQEKALAWADMLALERWCEELGVARGAHL